MVVIAAMLLGLISSCDNNKKSSSLPAAKVYVANESDGSITVIDLKDSLNSTNIDLSDRAETMFMPQIVQVTPDERSVLVTARGMDGNRNSISYSFYFALFSSNFT